MDDSSGSSMGSSMEADLVRNSSTTNGRFIALAPTLHPFGSPNQIEVKNIRPTADVIELYISAKTMMPNPKKFLDTRPELADLGANIRRLVEMFYYMAHRIGDEYHEFGRHEQYSIPDKIVTWEVVRRRERVVGYRLRITLQHYEADDELLGIKKKPAWEIQKIMRAAGAASVEVTAAKAANKKQKKAETKAAKAAKTKLKKQKKKQKERERKQKLIESRRKVEWDSKEMEQEASQSQVEAEVSTDEASSSDEDEKEDVDDDDNEPLDAAGPPQLSKEDIYDIGDVANPFQTPLSFGLILHRVTRDHAKLERKIASTTGSNARAGAPPPRYGAAAQLAQKASYLKLTHDEWIDLCRMYTGINHDFDESRSRRLYDPQSAVNPVNIFTLERSMKMAKKDGADEPYCNLLNYRFVGTLQDFHAARADGDPEMSYWKWPDPANTWRFPPQVVDPKDDVMNLYYLPHVKRARLTLFDKQWKLITADVTEDGVIADVANDGSAGAAAVTNQDTDVTLQAELLEEYRNLIREPATPSQHEYLALLRERIHVVKVRIRERTHEMYTATQLFARDVQADKSRLLGLDAFDAMKVRIAHEKEDIWGQVGVSDQDKHEHERKLVEEGMEEFFEQAYNVSGNCAPVIRILAAAKDKFLQEAENFCMPTERKMKNMTRFGEDMASLSVALETILRCNTLHGHAVALIMKALHVYADMALHPHSAYFGPPKAGKSYMMQMLTKLFVQGTVRTLGFISPKANMVAGNALKHFVLVMEDVAPSFMGVGPSGLQQNSSGANTDNSDQSSLIKSWLSEGKMACRVLIVTEGVRKHVEIQANCNSMVVVGSNVSASDVASPMASRYHCTTMTNNDRADGAGLIGKLQPDLKQLLSPAERLLERRVSRNQILISIVFNLIKTGIFPQIDLTIPNFIFTTVLHKAITKQSPLSNCEDARSVERLQHVTSVLVIWDAIGIVFDSPLSPIANKRFEHKDLWHLKRHLFGTTEHAVFAFGLLRNQWEDEMMEITLSSLRTTKFAEFMYRNRDGTEVDVDNADAKTDDNYYRYRIRPNKQPQREGNGHEDLRDHFSNSSSHSSTKNNGRLSYGVVHDRLNTLVEMQQKEMQPRPGRGDLLNVYNKLLNSVFFPDSRDPKKQLPAMTIEADSTGDWLSIGRNILNANANITSKIFTMVQQLLCHPHADDCTFVYGATMPMTPFVWQLMHIQPVRNLRLLRMLNPTYIEPSLKLITRSYLEAALKKYKDPQQRTRDLNFDAIFGEHPAAYVDQSLDVFGDAIYRIRSKTFSTAEEDASLPSIPSLFHALLVAKTKDTATLVYPSCFEQIHFKEFWTRKAHDMQRAFLLSNSTIRLDDDTLPCLEDENGEESKESTTSLTALPSSSIVSAIKLSSVIQMANRNRGESKPVHVDAAAPVALSRKQRKQLEAKQAALETAMELELSAYKTTTLQIQDEMDMARIRAKPARTSSKRKTRHEDATASPTTTTTESTYSLHDARNDYNDAFNDSSTTWKIDFANATLDNDEDDDDDDDASSSSFQSSSSRSNSQASQSQSLMPIDYEYAQPPQAPLHMTD